MRIARSTTVTRWLTWPLAVLLLVLQYGLLLHGLDHLGSDTHPDAPALPQHASCPVCVAHASGVGVLPASVQALPYVPTLAPPPATPAPRAPVPGTPAPYQVRAPPPALA
jgi:hypothetical protein